MNSPLDPALTPAPGLLNRTRRHALRTLSGTAIGLGALRAAPDGEARKKRKKKKRCRQRAPVLDVAIVSCAGPHEGGVTGTRRVAQTFTAPQSGVVTAATVEVAAFPEGADFILDIREVGDEGVPTNDVLTSAAINDVSATPFSAPRTVTAFFDPPANVEGGQAYALALTDAPVSIGYIVSVRHGNDCQGEAFNDAAATGAFVPIANLDLVYTLAMTFAT